MKDLFKKLAFILAATGMIFNLLMPLNLAFAQDPLPLKELQFQTTKYLNLGTDSTGKTLQGQSYFNTDPKSTEPQSKFPLIKFILTIIDIATKIAGTLAVILMIITGMVMIFSQGSQNTVEKAKQMFTYEILGLIVIFVSYVVITFVQSLLTTST